MAVSTLSISEDPYESLTSPDLDVYSTVGATSHNISGAKSTVKSRKSSHPFRLAAVGLGLLCAILLTATIALCVLYTRERGLEMLNARNCKDYTGQSQRDSISLSNEKNQLQENCTRLSNENDQLQRDYISLSNEKKQLQANCTSLSNEKDQLQRDYISLSNEKNQLQANCTSLSNKKNQLQENCTSLSNEKNQLQRDYNSLNNDKDQLGRNYFQLQENCTRLSNEKEQLQRDYNSHVEQCSTCPEGWKQLSSKCYFFSGLTKNWEDSRQYCKLQGAELVIINSQEEQEFITQRDIDYWIGLKYSENRNLWEWVDGTALQQAFWRLNNPSNSQRSPNETMECVFNGPGEELWRNWSCNYKWAWICETDASCISNKKLSN